MNADDSNGQIWLLARDLLELHVGVCDGGVADQVALAKWMVRFTFEDQDFFVVDPVRYAVALGEEGLSVYRAEVTRRAIGVGDRERSFAERYSRQRLAIIDRDVPALIEELGGDLSSPHQFSRVVEAMLELDDPDAALEWAQRGIAETDGWQVAKLYDLAASILSDRGEDDGVFRLRLQHHQRMPSGSTYRSLRTAAEVTGRWSDVRSDARELLEARSPGDYIDALLADHDTAEAWTAAMSNAAWQLDDRQWERLAAERESDDPAAAFDVYLRLADSALQAANRNAYRTAVRHLQAAGRCASRANLDAALHQHMVNLRNVHRRRPTFIAMLDKAKLP